MTEETEVIRRVVCGEVDAFQLLVRRYERPVFRLIGNLVANRHACEDVAQDVFLTAFRNLPTFDPRRSRFSTWLLTIARNKCLNALKKKAPSTCAELPHPLRRRTAHDDLVGKELFEQLDEALDALPPALRTVFVLAELMDLSNEEIAQVEGVKVGTVRSRLSRAKAKLRSLLRQYAGDEA